MTKLLDEAFEAVRCLTPHQQDEIARAVFELVGSDLGEPVPLSPEEREAIARSKAAAARGEFATDRKCKRSGLSTHEAALHAAAPFLS